MRLLARKAFHEPVGVRRLDTRRRTYTVISTLTGGTTTTRGVSSARVRHCQSRYWRRRLCRRVACAARRPRTEMPSGTSRASAMRVRCPSDELRGPGSIPHMYVRCMPASSASASWGQTLFLDGDSGFGCRWPLPRLLRVSARAMLRCLNSQSRLTYRSLPDRNVQEAPSGVPLPRRQNGLKTNANARALFDSRSSRVSRVLRSRDDARPSFWPHRRHRRVRLRAVSRTRRRQPCSDSRVCRVRLQMQRVADLVQVGDADAAARAFRVAFRIASSMLDAERH